MGGSRKKKLVGSGITSYRREETLYDRSYRRRARDGALVPSNVRIDPKRPIAEIRSKITKDSNAIFAKNDLPAPLSLIDPEHRYTNLDWSVAISKGDAYVRERCQEFGYHLSAAYHCPEEDHSELWYAARMCIMLAQIDIKVDQLRRGAEDSVELANALGESAIELGRLENEFRMKFKYEDSAQLGNKVKSGGAAGAKQTNQAHSSRTAQVLANMQARIDDGQSISDAARFTKEQDGFGTSPKANSKLWYRHFGSLK